MSTLNHLCRLPLQLLTEDVFVLPLPSFLIPFWRRNDIPIHRRIPDRVAERRHDPAGTAATQRFRAGDIRGARFRRACFFYPAIKSRSQQHNCQFPSGTFWLYTMTAARPQRKPCFRLGSLVESHRVEQRGPHTNTSCFKMHSFMLVWPLKHNGQHVCPHSKGLYLRLFGKDRNANVDRS